MKLESEEHKWKELIDKDVDRKLNEATSIWGKEKDIEFDKKLIDEIEKVRNMLLDEKRAELKKTSEEVEDRLKADFDEDLEKFKVSMEHEFHLRVDHEVGWRVVCKTVSASNCVVWC